MKIKPSMRYSLIDYKLYRKYFGDLDENATISYNNQALKIFYENLLDVPEEKIAINNYLLAYDNYADAIVIPDSRTLYIAESMANACTEFCAENTFVNDLQNFAGDIANFLITNARGMGLPYAAQKTTDHDQVEIQGWGFSTLNRNKITPFDCNSLFYDLFENLFFKHYEEITILSKKAKLFANLTFTDINDLEKIVFTSDTKTTDVTSADTPETPNTAIDNYANFKQSGKEINTHEKSLKAVLDEFKDDLFEFLYKVLPEIFIEREPDEVDYAF